MFMQTRLGLGRYVWRAGAVCALTATAAAVAACGSSGTKAASTPDARSSTQAAASSSSVSTALRRAEAAIAPYTGKPTPLPNLPTFTKPVRKGLSIAFMDPGSPSTHAYYLDFKQAAKPIGATVEDIPVGATASSVSAAFSSVAQKQPSLVAVAGTLPQEFASALATLKSEHIPIVSVGVIDGQKKWGFAASLGERGYQARTGKLLADYVYTQHETKTNVALYYPPELSYSPIFISGFEAEMRTLCSSCTVRPVKVSFTTFGTTAPSLVTSDLQAHPNTNAVVAASSAMLSGLPAALAGAGIHVSVYATPGTDPTSLQYLKAGQVTAVLGLDDNTLGYQMLDFGLRAIMHQPVSAALNAEGQAPPQEFLTPGSVTFNVAKGWVPYPHFANAFYKAWKVG